MIKLEIKLLIKLQESRKIFQIIIQKHMKKKYFEKDIYIYIYIYIYPGLRHKIIDGLRLKTEIY